MEILRTMPAAPVERSVYDPSCHAAFAGIATYKTSEWCYNCDSEGHLRRDTAASATSRRPSAMSAARA